MHGEGAGHTPACSGARHAWACGHRRLWGPRMHAPQYRLVAPLRWRGWGRGTVRDPVPLDSASWARPPADSHVLFLWKRDDRWRLAGSGAFVPGGAQMPPKGPGPPEGLAPPRGSFGSSRASGDSPLQAPPEGALAGPASQGRPGLGTCLRKCRAHSRCSEDVS